MGEQSVPPLNETETSPCHGFQNNVVGAVREPPQRRPAATTYRPTTPRPHDHPNNIMPYANANKRIP